MTNYFCHSCKENYWELLPEHQTIHCKRCGSENIEIDQPTNFREIPASRENQISSLQVPNDQEEVKNDPDEEDKEETIPSTSSRSYARLNPISRDGSIQRPPLRSNGTVYTLTRYQVPLENLSLRTMFSNIFQEQYSTGI